MPEAQVVDRAGVLVEDQAESIRILGAKTCTQIRFHIRSCPLAPVRFPGVVPVQQRCPNSAGDISGPPTTMSAG